MDQNPPSGQKSTDGDFFEELRRKSAGTVETDTAKLLPMPEPMRNRLDAIRQKSWLYRGLQVSLILGSLRYTGRLFERLGAYGSVPGYLSGFAWIGISAVVGLTLLALLRRRIVALNIARVHRASRLAHEDVAAGRSPRALDRIEEMAFLIFHVFGGCAGAVAAISIYAAAVDGINVPVVTVILLCGLFAGVTASVWLKWCSFTYQAMLYTRENVRSLSELMKQQSTRGEPVWRRYQQEPKELIKMEAKPNAVVEGEIKHR